MMDEKKNNSHSQSNKTSLPDPEQLREQAEKKAKAVPLPELNNMRLEEIQHMVYEMQVKQIEADLQFEQLRSQVEGRNDKSELFSIVTENMLDMVALTDMEGNFTFAGKSHEIMGYEPGFLIGKNVLDFVHPEDLPRILKEFSEFVASGHPRKVEYRNRCKDGTYLWLETVGIFIKDEKGIPQKIVFSSRDITDRKHAEIALRESEQRFKTIIQNLPGGVFAHDLEGRLLFVNKTASIITGYSEQELLSMTVPEIDSGDFTKDERYQLWQSLNIGESSTIHSIHTRKDGSKYPVEIHLNAIILDNQPVILPIVIDITERKQAEKAIENERAYLSAVIDNIEEAIVICDAEGRIARFNEMARRLHGLPEQPIPPDQWAQHYDLYQEDRVTPLPTEEIPLFRALQGESVLNAEIVVAPKHSRPYSLVCNGRALTDETGKITGAVVAMHDITERKQAEKELAKNKIFLESIFNSIQDGLSILDSELNIKYTNPIMEQWYAENMPLVGQKCYACYHNNDKPCNPCPTLRCFESGETESDYVPGLPGSPVEWIELFSHPMKDTETREIIGAIEFVRDITERMKMERHLKESKERLDLALRGTNTGLWDWNVQTGEVIFNEQWAEILGYRLEELEPISIQTWENLCHPDDLEVSNNKLEQHFSGKTDFYECEARMKHKNGSWVYIMDRGKVSQWDNDKEPLRMTGVHIDLTERKQKEAALRQSENYYRAIFETSATAMFILEEDTTISHVNSNFEELLGYSKQEVEGNKSWTEFIHADDVGWMKRYHYLRRHDTRAAPLNYEFRFFVRNGELRHGYLSVDMIADTTQSVASIIDITERKQVEQQLRENEEKYRMLVENLNEVIYTIDEKGRITYVSPSVESASGYTPSELLGKQFIDFVHPDDREGRLKPFHRILSGIDEPSEYRYVTKDNQVIWVRTTARPLQKEGRITGLQGVLVDITERKKAEQERDRLQAQLRQSQKMEAIGALAGGIAHDFNNILSSVLGYTELSIDEVEKGSLLHQNLSQVLTAGNRAKDLVKQILAFGRKEEQEFTPTPIVPLVKEALKMLRSTFPSFIEIRENISIEQAIVYADPTQLHQVIVNLATNAKQAMSDEGGLLEVSVETASFDENIEKKYPDLAPGNYVRITVNDTGNGISEQYIDKIFDPYFTTSETGTGTGLGLSVVHGIVKAHKGHITVYSELGQGTTFHVYLPLAEQEQSRAASTVQGGEALPPGTESVLIVDDEKPIVEIQQQILEGLGYRVTPRTSSVEALEAFRANPDKFDIVITDMTMPDMTGNRLALKIKEIRSDVPVILCTGFSEKIDDQKKGEMGIEGLMLKPVARTELAETVRKILDKSGND